MKTVRPTRKSLLAAEAVAEGRAEHQEDGEGERVGAHRPFQVVQRAAQVLADGGQGGGDDEVVQGRHETGDAGDDEGPGLRPRPVRSDVLVL
ncbi:hypothetical protein SVIOM342S_07304 [Streptomyces violaceorubidus]